ncbi:MAG: hypothetical protein WD404_03595 [Solirubrobacterales bacterium]
MPESKLLWRLANQSTLDTLRGESRGQYDIRLGRHPTVDDFFDGLPRILDHKGSMVKIQTERIANADGDLEIPPYPLEIRRMSEDLALLCANCHRMVHAKRPWLSVEQLRSHLK